MTPKIYRLRRPRIVKPLYQYTRAPDPFSEFDITKEPVIKEVRYEAARDKLYEKRLSIYSFPVHLLEGMLRTVPDLVWESVQERMGDDDNHVVRIVVEPCDDEEKFIRDMEDRYVAIIRIVREQEEKARRARELAKQQKELRRQARLGGGNARQQRRKRRALRKSTCASSQVTAASPSVG